MASRFQKYMRCVYPSCGKTKADYPDLVFFGIRSPWLQNLGMDETTKISKYMRVCAEHFPDEHFNSTLRTHLLPGAIPFKHSPALAMEVIKMEGGAESSHQLIQNEPGWLPNCTRQMSHTTSGFRLQNVLLLQKLSRLQVERLRRPDFDDQELEASFRERGIDCEAMKTHHAIQANFLAKTQEAFKTFGLNIRTVNRFNYTEADIKWCDAVVPIGGDGTFLLAASRVMNNQKPVIGLNSDPCRSEGHLCLPQKYSSNIELAIKKLLNGSFRWMFRTRIRVTLIGNNIHGTPVELHDQALRFKVKDFAVDEIRRDSSTVTLGGSRVLPVLALNEVFLGENLSAKVSYFEIKLNGVRDTTKVKCSGVCVCTGTGSSSWNLSMNRFSQDDVRQVLQLYSESTGNRLDDALVPEVCNKFNQRFLFQPDAFKMGYTIRDMIYAAVWPKPKDGMPARSLVMKMQIKSKCSDAGLVIDGGISFPFNDGTTAILETNPEDCLRTVIINE